LTAKELSAIAQQPHIHKLSVSLNTKFNCQFTQSIVLLNNHLEKFLQHIQSKQKNDSKRQNFVTSTYSSCCMLKHDMFACLFVCAYSCLYGHYKVCKRKIINIIQTESKRITKKYQQICCQHFLVYTLYLSLKQKLSLIKPSTNILCHQILKKKKSKTSRFFFSCNFNHFSNVSSMPSSFLFLSNKWHFTKKT